MKCTEECKENEASCLNETCRYWMEYPEDLNCTLICAQRNGPLTLQEVSKRIGVSYVRVKQIQDKALEKINIRLKKIDEKI